MILALPARRYAALADEVLTACEVVPDGDAKVASEQSLAVAAAPEPPPDPDAAVVKLSYRSATAGSFVRVVPPRGESRRIAGEPKAIGVWIYGDGRANDSAAASDRCERPDVAAGRRRDRLEGLAIRGVRAEAVRRPLGRRQGRR